VAHLQQAEAKIEDKLKGITVANYAPTWGAPQAPCDSSRYEWIGNVVLLAAIQHAVVCKEPRQCCETPPVRLWEERAHVRAHVRDTVCACELGGQRLLQGLPHVLGELLGCREEETCRRA
jgi:hypothetical protein